MSVRVLAPELTAHIRSEFTIDSAAQCVLEMVENSVDARASHVTVKVDPLSWRIEVVDNGEGISLNDIRIVGERYATSKCHSMQDLKHPKWLGFRGEALASIIQVARSVELTSRHYLSQQTYCKLFQAGRSVGTLPSLTQCRNAGTIVTVHDLFYNLPVRRKRMSDALEMEQIKMGIQSTILIHPETSLSLHNEQTGQCLLQVSPTHSLLARFRQLFGRYKASSLKTVHVQQVGVKATGLLSTQTHHSRSLQFLCVNRRLTQSPEMHSLLNSLMTSVVTQKHNTEMGDPTGFKKTQKRYPIYVVTAEVSNTDLDLCLNPTKTHVYLEHNERLQTALTCLLVTFLSENHFPLNHPNVVGSKSAAVTEGRGTSPLNFSRSRVSCKTSVDQSHGTGLTQHAPFRGGNVPVVLSSHGTLIHPSSAGPASDTGHSSTHWKKSLQPATRSNIYVHPATGCTMSDTELGKCVPCTMLPSGKSASCNLLPNLYLPSVKESKVQPASLEVFQCASSALSSWTNPTFSYGYQDVLSVNGVNRQRAPTLLNHYKFSKAMFSHTKVLGQVDNKFVVCLLSVKKSGCQDLLAVIDQHAAHERVRLEALLEGLYDGQQHVKVSQVDPPLELALSASMQELARLFSAHLKSIGVSILIESGRVFTTSLPSVLMEKEAEERKRGRPAVAVHLLQEMITKHIELLQATSGGLSGLPSSLAEVLHSQACHGAIKFGDHLTRAECKALVCSLSQCALPFQCAHGR